MSTQLLRSLPWRARWPVAELKDRRQIPEMIEEFAPNLALAGLEFGRHRRNVAHEFALCRTGRRRTPMGMSFTSSSSAAPTGTWAIGVNVSGTGAPRAPCSFQLARRIEGCGAVYSVRLDLTIAPLL